MPELRSYQKEAFQAMKDKSAFYLCHPIGVGKTPVVLSDMDRLIQEGKVKRILYVAPISTLENVRRRALEWTKMVKPQVVVGSRKARIHAIENPGIWNTDLINFEATRILAPELRKAGYDMVVVDEGKRIAGHDAEQTKVVKLVGRQAKYRRVLAGLPFSESIEDAWSQFDFLNPTIFAGGFYCFRNRYCQLETREVPMRDKNHRMIFEVRGFACATCGRTKNELYGQETRCGFDGSPFVPKSLPKMRKFKVVKGVKNLAEFEVRIAPYIHVVSKKEALPDLPDISFVERYIELLAEQRKIYDSVENEAATHLDELEIDHKSAMAHMQKCRQVAAGFIYDGEKVAHYVPTSKYETLIENLEDSLGPAGKAVVFTSFKAEPPIAVDRLGRAGFKAFDLTACEPSERQVRIDEWAKEERQSVLVANTISGGTGLNLQPAALAIFLSNDFRYHDREQATGRIHRSGSEIHKKISVIDILTRNTIEEDIWNALQGKGEVVQLFIERLRRRQAAMKGAVA